MTSNKPYKRIFKLEWLSAINQTCRRLEPRVWIKHQDIAPRNLTVDEATGNIMLFDFNCSSHIGGPLCNGETV